MITGVSRKDCVAWESVRLGFACFFCACDSKASVGQKAWPHNVLFEVAVVKVLIGIGILLKVPMVLVAVGRRRC